MKTLKLTTQFKKDLKRYKHNASAHTLSCFDRTRIYPPRLTICITFSLI